MNLVEAALTRIAADLDDLGQRWALVGGFAVSVRSEPRFTRDVDVAVAVADDQTAESLVRALLGRGYRVTATIEQDEIGRLATARLIPPLGAIGDDLVVDLLFASSGVEQEVVSGADVLDVLPGLRISVAGIGELIALKLLARDDRLRPQDAADLQALGRVWSTTDLDRAETIIDLIAARGFDRGRDLRAALADLAIDVAPRGPG